MLNKIFKLAIDFGKTDRIRAIRIRKFKLDNQRYRYLLPEEPLLMEVLKGERAFTADGNVRNRHETAVKGNAVSPPQSGGFFPQYGYGY